MVKQLKNIVSAVPYPVGVILARVPFSCRLGKMYGRMMEECARAIEWSDAERERYSAEKFRTIFEYARLKFPCYRELYEKAGVALTEHLDDRVGVAFDEGGRLFKQLEVSFIPFCVVCDKKRRTQWCGNGAMFTRDVMNNILTTK